MYFASAGKAQLGDGKLGFGMGRLCCDEKPQEIEAMLAKAPQAA
jgi:hypothetical protein